MTNSSNKIKTVIENGVKKVSTYYTGQFANNEEAESVITIFEHNSLNNKVLDLSFCERVAEKGNTIVFYNFCNELYYFVAKA